MLNSFCGYTIVIFVFFDDSLLGFDVFIEIIKYLIFPAMLAL